MSASKSRSRRPPRDQPFPPLCRGHLIAAPLWVAFEANLGTLLRTCDAVGACIAVPDTVHYRRSLARGDTLGGRRPCIHWLRGKERWVGGQRDRGWQIVAVELQAHSTPLRALQPASGPTVVLLGHEREGVPPDQLDQADVCVEIPMGGAGRSLNVAVAGSLVLYKLAGLV